MEPEVFVPRTFEQLMQLEEQPKVGEEFACLPGETTTGSLYIEQIRPWRVRGREVGKVLVGFG